MQDRYEEALPLVREASITHYPDALSWFQVATCLDRMGYSEEAVEAFENAATLGQDYDLAWYEWGGSLWNLGRQEEAVAIWSEALSRFPDHERAQEARQFTSRYDEAYSGNLDEE